jgi:hypothetical protein
MNGYSNTIKFSILLILISFGLSISGCAVFKGGKVPDTILIPVEKTDKPKPTISYDITGTEKLLAGTTNPQRRLPGELLQILEQSDYFSRISRGSDEADVTLFVIVEHEESPAGLIAGVISGLTLFTIPTWYSQYFEVTAIVKNRQSNSKKYILSDSATLVMWIPMIFVFPVHNFSVSTEVRNNMYRNILLQMKNDGFITNNNTVKRPVTNQ